MPHDTDLKRRLELAGLTVIEVDDWRTRGSSTFDPAGSVNHHTAGPSTGVAPSLGICINGRSDLPGPLCNTFGARTYRLDVHLVAAGRANHAGRGGWKGLVGNSRVYGHEEEHSGTQAEPLHLVHYDRMVRVHAAYAFDTFDPDFTCQHWQWTERKVDFLRAYIDPVTFEADVRERLRLMHNPPTQPDEDDDMAFLAISPDNGRGYLFEPKRYTLLNNETFGSFKDSGMPLAKATTDNQWNLLRKGRELVKTA